MSATVVPPAAPAGALHTRRCVRHPTREAAARCPGCGQFFCRECVVEHDGRLLCRDCLQRDAAARQRSRRGWGAAAKIGNGVLAFVVLWLIFGTLGGILLRIPPELHDGSMWKRAHERSRP
jgi:hypothetical protein